jgi:hypothetical protein
MREVLFAKNTLAWCKHEKREVKAKSFAFIASEP